MTEESDDLDQIVGSRIWGGKSVSPGIWGSGDLAPVGDSGVWLKVWGLEWRGAVRGSEGASLFSPFAGWQEEEDLPYEEEIMRNQFSVKCWLRYIEFKQGAPKPRLNQLYERALKLLPCRWERLPSALPAPAPTPPCLVITRLASRSQVIAFVVRH